MEAETSPDERRKERVAVLIAILLGVPLVLILLVLLGLDLEPGRIRQWVETSDEFLFPDSGEPIWDKPVAPALELPDTDPLAGRASVFWEEIELGFGYGLPGVAHRFVIESEDALEQARLLDLATTERRALRHEDRRNWLANLFEWQPKSRDAKRIAQTTPVAETEPARTGQTADTRDTGWFAWWPWRKRLSDEDCGDVRKQNRLLRIRVEELERRLGIEPGRSASQPLTTGIPSQREVDQLFRDLGKERKVNAELRKTISVIEDSWRTSQNDVLTILKNTEAEQAKLSSTIKNLQRSRDEMRAAMQREARENEKLRSELALFRDELKRTREAAETMDSLRTQTANKTEAELIAKIKEHMTARQQLDARVKLLETQLAALSPDTANPRGPAGKKPGPDAPDDVRTRLLIQNYEQEKARMRQAADDLKKENERIKLLFVNLEKDKTRLQQDLGTVKEENAQIKLLVRKLQQQQPDAVSGSGMNGGNPGNASGTRPGDTRIKKLEQEKTAIQHTADKLKRDNEQIKLLVANLEKEKTGLQTNLNALSKENTQFKQLVQKLQRGQPGAASSGTATANHESGAANPTTTQQAAKLAEQLTMLESTVGKLEGDLERERARNKAMQEAFVLAEKTKAGSGSGSVEQKLNQLHTLYTRAQDQIYNLQGDLLETRAMADERQKEVSRLAQVLSKTSDPDQSANSISAELADLRTKYADSQARIRELERWKHSNPSAVTQQRADAYRSALAMENPPVDARNPGDLSIRAQPLFKSLQHAANNNIPIAERDRIAKIKNWGTLLARCYFDRAQSSPTKTCRNRLGEAMRGVPADAFVLVVGYASVTGDEAFNERLSRDRATTVTSLVRPKLNNKGKVQMVYFGETSQFDSKDLAKNRVVEVWRIDH